MSQIRTRAQCFPTPDLAVDTGIFADGPDTTQPPLV